MNFESLGLRQIETRATALAPTMIDSKTFTAVIARGTAIAHKHFTERLRISGSSIDLCRMMNDCSIPLLDSLMEDSALARSLGKLIGVEIRDGAIWGSVRFHQTEQGRKAAELVTAGACDIALAYEVSEYEVFDANNQRVDCDDLERSDEPGIIFEATRWQPVALGLVRADPAAYGSYADRAYTLAVDPEVAASFKRVADRQFDLHSGDHRFVASRARPQMTRSIFDMASDRGADDQANVVRAIRARVRAAQALIQSEQLDTGWRDVIMPPEMGFYGRPERM
jgi:hypothetical protein